MMTGGEPSNFLGQLEGQAARAKHLQAVRPEDICERRGVPSNNSVTDRLILRY